MAVYAYVQVQAATTTEELLRIVNSEDFDFRFRCGFSKPACNINISHKDELVKTIWIHYVFFAQHAELEQLRKGFRETLQMELPICLCPDEVYSLLVASAAFEVSTSFFLDDFIVKYSDKDRINALLRKL